MAAKDEIKEAIQELMRDHEQWGRPDVTASQTPEMVTAQIVPPPPMASLPPPSPMSVDPMFLRSQMMVQQQALASQAMMQSQMNLASYAAGTPGARAPSYSMSDPTAANYQLQGMYNMNPYAADFYSRQQGGAGMRMAPSQFAVNPSLGIFRDSSNQMVRGPSSTMSLARDVFTLQPAMRSFAVYEDIVDARIESHRNLTRFKESAALSALEILPAAAAFLPGVGMAAGLAMSVAAAPIAVVGAAYQQRRAEASRVADISKMFSTNATSGGFRGTGYSLSESAGMMQKMRGLAADSSMYNTSDVFQVLESGAQNNMFGFNSNSGATFDKLKGIISNLDVFMRLSGDADVQSAMQRMGNLQSLGFSTTQMQSAASNLKAFSRLAGTSVDDLMSTHGAYGAQMAAQTGAPGAFGLTVGAMSPGVIRGATQTGAINEMQLALMGGQEGASQQVTRMVLNSVQGHIGKQIGAFVKFDGDMPSVDKAALTEYLTTGKLKGGFANIGDAAANAVARLGDNQKKNLFTMQAELAGGAMMELDDPTKQIGFVRRYMQDLKKVMPGMRMQDVLVSQFGDNWRAMDYYMSDANEAAQISQQRESLRSSEAARREKFYIDNSYLSRFGVGASKAFDRAMNFFDYQGAGRDEQDKAERAAGGYVVGTASKYGIGTDFSESLRRFRSDGAAGAEDTFQAAMKVPAINALMSTYRKGGYYNGYAVDANKAAVKAFMADAAAISELANTTPSTALSEEAVRGLSLDVLADDTFNAGVLARMQDKGQAAAIYNHIRDRALNKDLSHDQAAAFAKFEEGRSHASSVNEDARLAGFRKKYVDAANYMGVDQNDAVNVQAYIKTINAIPGADKLSKADFDALSGTFLAQREHLSLDAAQGMFQEVGLELTAEQYAATSKAAKEARSGMDEYRSANKDMVTDFMSKFTTFSASGVSTASSAGRPGLWLSPEERQTDQGLQQRAEEIFNRSRGPTSTSYSEGYSEADKKQLSDIKNQLGIARDASNLDLHNNGSSEQNIKMMTSLAVKQVALLEKIANKGLFG